MGETGLCMVVDRALRVPWTDKEDMSPTAAFLPLVIVSGSAEAQNLWFQGLISKMLKGTGLG